jgi:hypothetical protein
MKDYFKETYKNSNVFLFLHSDSVEISTFIKHKFKVWWDYNKYFIYVWNEHEMNENIIDMCHELHESLRCFLVESVGGYLHPFTLLVNDTPITYQLPYHDNKIIKGGTRLSLVFICNEEKIITVSLGDTDIYLINNETMIQLSEELHVPHSIKEHLRIQSTSRIYDNLLLQLIPVYETHTKHWFPPIFTKDLSNNWMKDPFFVDEFENEIFYKFENGLIPSSKHEPITHAISPMASPFVVKTSITRSIGNFVEECMGMSHIPFIKQIPYQSGKIMFC